MTPFMPLLILQVLEPWVALSNDERRAWLNNKLAALQEYQVLPNGVLWTIGKSDAAGEFILMLWQLVDEDAVHGFSTILDQPDVKNYFGVTIHAGALGTSQEAIFTPFFSGSV